MKAKSDIDFHKIHLQPAFRDLQNHDVKAPDTINGFDTETADGKLFMISYCFDGFSPKTVSGDDLSDKEIFDLLTNRKARNAHNVWYNLNYDVGVLLSHICDRKDLQILKYTGEVELSNGYEISYIPGKFMTIKDDSKHKYNHYDASQFFYTNLENAAKEWLDIEKLDDVNAAKFGLDNRELNRYIRDNWQDIERYAKRDAQLVRDLWRRFCKLAVNDNIPINKPFSTGYIAQAYFENQTNKKPGFRSNDLQELSMETYAGGRFEIFKRGRFNSVTGYDINSAYPYHMIDLPDLDSCHIRYFEDCDIDDILQYELGVCDVTVSTYNGDIQPFTIKDNVRIFPRLVDYDISVTLPEIKMAMRHNMIESIDVNKAFIAETLPDTNYPFRYNKDIYELRQKEKRKGNMQRQKVLKIILNSLYGKFIQTTPKRRIESADYELATREVDGEQRFSERELLAAQLPKEIDDLRIVERMESGKLFNPFLASHITAKTRVQLVDFVINNGLEDKLIMLATDCVMIEGENHSVGEYIGDKLGEWAKEYAGEAFVVAPGVYEVNGEKNKLKTRGFKPGDVNFSLIEYIQEHGDTIEYEQPLSLRAAIHRGKPVSDIGMFEDKEKEIQPDMDSKREWAGGETWQELLSDNYKGKPFVKHTNVSA